MAFSARYYDWLDRLSELMDWQKTGPGAADYQWKCGDPETGDRFALAKQAAADTGQPFSELMSVARSRGSAKCDCELIFNCDDRD